MKIYFFNDQKESIVVQVNHQNRPSSTNPHGDLSINYYQLDAQVGRAFDVDAPEDSIPYVKNWGKYVLLSYIRESALLEQIGDASKG